MGINPAQATANSKLQGAYMISVSPGTSNASRGHARLDPLAPLQIRSRLLFLWIRSILEHGRKAAASRQAARLFIKMLERITSSLGGFKPWINIKNKS